MVNRPPLEANSPNDKSPNATIKFLCSYGGKIIPRHPDGKLRYHGGHTRVLSVHRSISFSELLVKMGDLCGTTVCLRCQLPTEDLDALVSIKSDEDLLNLIEEYDRVASSSLKIRAFLSPPMSRSSSIRRRSPSPPASEYAVSSPSLSPKSLSPSPKSLSPSSSFNATSPRFVPIPVTAIPVCYGKLAPGCNHCHRNSTHIYLIHNGNHCQ